MTPEQINTWTDAAIRGKELVDLYGPGLLAASCLYTGWKTSRWACRTVLRGWDRLQERRALRRLPAAPDNQPPTDIDALAECRRIARQPITNPDDWRRADQYLRQKGDDTP